MDEFNAKTMREKADAKHERIKTEYVKIIEEKINEYALNGNYHLTYSDKDYIECIVANRKYFESKGFKVDVDNNDFIKLASISW